MKQVIPVWVINLKKRPDRLKAIASRLDALGIEWTKLEAVDGANCDENELNISKQYGKIGEISNGARACSASHHKFWSELISSNFKYGIILEDDVELSDDFKNLVCDLSWIPKNSNLIKLEKAAPNKPSKLLLGPNLSNALNNTRQVRKMYSRHCGTAAYLLSREGAEIAVNWQKPFSVPIDHLLFNETVSKLCTVLNSLILTPPISWQSHGVGQGSNIINDKVFTSSKRKYFFRSLKRGYYECRLLPYQLFLLVIGAAKIVIVNKE
ncbi:glycosyltransferase family 25 protein [Amylibacter sp.]|nr:glycosyltransferase family 25 protein [Amylibacter sp.]